MGSLTIGRLCSELSSCVGFDELEAIQLSKILENRLEENVPALPDDSSLLFGTGVKTGESVLDFCFAVPSSSTSSSASCFRVDSDGVKTDVCVPGRLYHSSGTQNTYFVCLLTDFSDSKERIASSGRRVDTKVDQLDKYISSLYALFCTYLPCPPL